MIALSRFILSIAFFQIVIINSFFNATKLKLSQLHHDMCIPFAVNEDCQSTVTFNITLGFSMTWQPLLLLSTSAEFREFAQRVEEAASVIFRNAQLPGKQNVRVLSFWKGSLMTNLSLSSTGHAIKTMSLFTKLNSTLHSFLIRPNNSFLGHEILVDKCKMYLPESSSSNRPTFRSQQINQQEKLLLIDKSVLHNLAGSEVVVKPETPEKSVPKSKGFLKQPVLLGIVIAAAVALVILIILCILYCLYRARKADEGSYALNNKPKMVPLVSGKAHQRSNAREFFA